MLLAPWRSGNQTSDLTWQASGAYERDAESSRHTVTHILEIFRSEPADKLYQMLGEPGAHDAYNPFVAPGQHQGAQ